MKYLRNATLIVLLATAVAWADRTDVWDATTVTVKQATLEPLADGGCMITVFASVAKGDGGVMVDTTAGKELAGANRTACLDILNNKALVLFKTDKGL